MKKAITSFLIFLMMISYAIGQNVLALFPDSAKQIISKHIYGHFAEHLGRCIYGGFYVGDHNLKISNTSGIRNDVIAALKKLKIPNLRWPGGCFADTYHWKDGVGRKENRPSIVNTWWGGVTEDNSFGTNEFLNMCELLGTEPYLSTNIGSGTVQEVIDWVQYVNFSGKSPMSDLRRKNGRDKPWNVKFWCVGNEAWGCGGNMRPEYYADQYRKYATFMSGWSNETRIMRIASGASDNNYQWTEILMKNIPPNMLGGLALHHYSLISWDHKGSSTDFTEEQYFRVMKETCRTDSFITRHAAIMDRYDPLKKIALVVDEWGAWYDVEPGTNPGFLYQQNTMRDAMVAGVSLNIFNNHCDRVKMANLAQTINVLQSVILTDGEKMLLTPTYYVMEMYNVHQDALLIPIKIKSNSYTLGDDSLQAVSVSASKDTVGCIHITLTNIDANKNQDVTLLVQGGSFKSVKGRILTSAKLQDYNTFQDPEKIKPVPFTTTVMKDGRLQLNLPPFSVVVLEMR